MHQLTKIYRDLMKLYGPQGWWPLLDYQGTNPTKTGSVTGYHVGDYSYPKTEDQRFEICVGAILTQNTSWVSVEKALRGLQKINALTPKKLLALPSEEIKAAIRPAGYFNQKEKKLRIFASWYATRKNTVPSRDELLALWGIGPETADSMLLYAFNVPAFVVDAYTKRIFAPQGFFLPHASYDEIKLIFERALPKNIIIYQEYHALIVEHAKRTYQKNNIATQKSKPH